MTEDKSRVQEESGYLAVEKRGTLLRRRLLLWIFSGVILAAFPIYTDVFRGLHAGSVSMDTILAKGEQFVLGGILTLGAAGEILAAAIPQKEKNWAVFTSMSAICMGVANLLAYVFIPEPSNIVMVTMVLGIGALITSATCIGMAAGR